MLISGYRMVIRLVRSGFMVTVLISGYRMVISGFGWLSVCQMFLLTVCNYQRVGRLSM